MEKDILMDGIILYTKDDELKWEVYNEKDLISEYKTKTMISNSKELQIRFYCNYKDMKKSAIEVNIQSEPNRITTYAYMLSTDFHTGNRFKELSDLINNKLKRVIS